jgi:exodeoxyribonuclease V alpha subunit
MPNGTCRYNSRNRLPYRVIVVDEASMADISILSRLMEAAPKDCRILLVGDMHQLPSVDAGAVLGDLTARFSNLPGYPTLTPQCANWALKISAGIPHDSTDAETIESIILRSAQAVKQAGLLADHVVVLTRSYRHQMNISAISGCVNSGNSREALKLMRTEASAVKIDSRTGTAPVTEWLDSFYSGAKIEPVIRLRELDFEAAENPTHPQHAAAKNQINAAFEIMNESRILTITHKGPVGRLAINRLAEQMIRPTLFAGRNTRFFHGQPVIVNTSMHSLNLYNGDTGMAVLPTSGEMKIIFKRGNSFRIYPVQILTGLESAFAITVHKAQGSEFDRVLIVLGTHKSPLLTKQIIYTALTRARKHAVILGSEQIFIHAVESCEERPGGIDIP